MMRWISWLFKRGGYTISQMSLRESDLYPNTKKIRYDGLVTTSQRKVRKTCSRPNVSRRLKRIMISLQRLTSCDKCCWKHKSNLESLTDTLIVQLSIASLLSPTKPFLGSPTLHTKIQSFFKTLNSIEHKKSQIVASPRIHNIASLQKTEKIKEILSILMLVIIMKTIRMPVAPTSTRSQIFQLLQPSLPKFPTNNQRRNQRAVLQWQPLRQKTKALDYKITC